MSNSHSMFLIADKDSFSNSSLIQGLKRLGLAENIVCTSSISSTIAYLHKQRTCSYPFPDFILYNSHSMNTSEEEFLEVFNQVFTNQEKSKLIFLKEKAASKSLSEINGKRVFGELLKPISLSQLTNIFELKSQKVSVST